MVAETELWTPLQLYTQRRMAALASFVDQSAALVSDGRYVSLYLDADMPPALAVEIVGAFGRAMVCGPREAVRRAGDALRMGGCEVLADLAYMAGDAREVARMAGRVRDAFVLPSGLSCHALTEACADEDVRVIQQLQLAEELVPLPRAGLFDARAATAILRTMAGQVVGFSSVFNLARAAERPGWYQMGGVCVDAAWRGLGLGSYMTACAILQAVARGDARYFIASVHGANLASVKMHRACGMEIDADHAFLFARVSRAREAALLAAG